MSMHYVLNNDSSMPNIYLSLATTVLLSVMKVASASCIPVSGGTPKVGAQHASSL